MERSERRQLDFFRSGLRAQTFNVSKTLDLFALLLKLLLYLRVRLKIDEVVIGMSNRVAEIHLKVDALVSAFNLVPEEFDENEERPAPNGALPRMRSRGSMLD